MNTEAITQKEFLYWKAEIERKGFTIFQEERSYNENCIDFFIEEQPTVKTYVLMKHTNGLGKTFYYKNIDVIGDKS